MTNPFSRQPATADYSIRKGDTGPAIEAQLTNVDGSTVDLTDASEVRLYIRRQADGADVVNTAIAIDDAADGQVSHEFDNGFSSTGDGMHSLYFEVQFSSGSIESYPRGGVAYLWVPERFADGDLADLDPQNAEVGVLTADDLRANTIAGRGGPLQWSTDQDANGNDLTGLGAVGATTLSPGSMSEQIGTTQLSNEAVTAAKIAAAAVESGAIASSAVGSDAIATDAVGSDAIASDSVTVDELAAALGTTSENRVPGTTHFENTKHEALEAKTIANDRIYARSFDGSNADTRLDNALSAAADGDVVMLENAQYSSERTITTQLLLIGTMSSRSSGTQIEESWTFDSRAKLTNVAIRGSTTEIQFNVNGSFASDIAFRGISPTVRFSASQCAIYNAIATGTNGAIVFDEETSGGLADSIRGPSVTDNGDNTVGDVA